MNGDEAALHALMERYGDEMTRTAYLLTRDRQAAEEATMDAFVQAFGRIRQLKHPDKLRSWLLRIVANRCRMRMRAWSWRRVFPFADVDRLSVATATDPENLLLAEWRSERLSDAILRLDYKYREPIVLYYFNEMSVSEIAEQTSEKENTIKSRLARARAKLKEWLEEEEDGDESGENAGAGAY
ncbi:sigma-70 family RNA polymerase sigma factor [Cohnella suwonensis]|uniref:Sigma-70 family RNA polymerase sigma factor n=1 Tax=Cohnella suwonensis TaxID=696072 RepID=A0ABW0LUW2_9BACL